jgi:hypothetical protein
VKKHVCKACRGKLGLGVRFRRLWRGDAWHHLRFCSTKCEARFEKELRDARARVRWFSFLAS